MLQARGPPVPEAWLLTPVSSLTCAPSGTYPVATCSEHFLGTAHGAHPHQAPKPQYLSVGTSRRTVLGPGEIYAPILGAVDARWGSMNP